MTTVKSAPLPGPGALAMDRAAEMSRAEVEVAAANAADKAKRLKDARDRAKGLRMRLEAMPDPAAGIRAANKAWIKARTEREAAAKAADKRIAELRQALVDAELAAIPAIDDRAKLAKEWEQAEAAVKRLEGTRG